jgi:hypothetical protein
VDQEELDKIIEKHIIWRETGGEEGEKANFLVERYRIWLLTTTDAGEGLRVELDETDSPKCKELYKMYEEFYSHEKNFGGEDRILNELDKLLQ